MKNEQTAVIKDMEFLLNELHKEWERPGETGRGKIVCQYSI